MREVKAIPKSEVINKYDYAKLFNGSVWEMKRGADFTVHPMSFKQSMYTAARRRGIAITCQMRGDIVFVQALGPKK